MSTKRRCQSQQQVWLRGGQSQCCAAYVAPSCIDEGTAFPHGLRLKALRQLYGLCPAARNAGTLCSNRLALCMVQCCSAAQPTSRPQTAYVRRCNRVHLAAVEEEQGNYESMGRHCLLPPLAR